MISPYRPGTAEHNGEVHGNADLTLSLLLQYIMTFILQRETNSSRATPTLKINMANTSQSEPLTAEQIRTLLHDAENDYKSNNPKSQKLHEKAIGILPGGNTRSILHTDPFPICMDRGEGNRLIDVDGHKYAFQFPNILDPHR